jgi:c-di-GMP-related signal transduction protein
MSTEKQKLLFMARQPIFDRNEDVIAYELLFRNSKQNIYPGVEQDSATSSVLTNTFMIMGHDTVTNGKKAYINFTRNMLVKDVIKLFPCEQVVIEILETIKPEERLKEICINLKKSGYLLALDDFIFESDREFFLDLVDIVKIDFRKTTPQQRMHALEINTRKDLTFLAEKVENLEEYQFAKEIGFHLFQGFFFEQPKILSTWIIPENKLNYMQILKETNNSDFQFSTIELYIKRDPSLVYKLLRFINSSAFGFRKKIDSIKQALIMLGIRELRKWLGLVALNSIAEGKNPELLKTTLIRAICCEAFARFIGKKSSSDQYFLMGMLSLIDVFIDKPLEGILDELQVGEKIKQVLLGCMNDMSPVMDLMLALEKQDVQKLEHYTGTLNINYYQISEIYCNAVSITATIYPD